MTTSIITQKMIAQALKELMKLKPFQKISVSDIMKQCDMRRQTFYYHFQDKYELLAWIYQSDTKEQIADFLDYERWDTILYQLFRYFYDHQTFYKNALSITEQNDFGDYLFHELHGLFTYVIKALSHHTSRDQLDYQAKFFAHGFVGMTKDWLTSGCTISPEAMRDIVYGLLDEQLKISSHESEETQ
ncbi:probable dihydroxyacetone kinase regulator [Halolactibacillus halophilus]|uniref:Dihydroxyacetone kinase transcriptional activator DhaS n=2 Tax=Halolactibacillus halophilus TaxID=306540 RepID=A0A1I5Q8M7_9BACI|nr:dihydroxyacetone kinase transcriptional activator DhaS [Halolactibacillus halophilus]GEM01644.1 dihydroxyacetone kinase transcriptional activator DhaS [Halolactibacillus halophilus]SFP42371.1 probable dihydroxyacetone kinase regulator [Halolactibacillus halophilus]